MSITSSTLVEKVSGVLSARMGRRGFFARSAVVGTALAANPVTYALTPTDAYAAICSCQGQGLRVRVVLLRRLHRVLLHPHRPQPVPARHGARRLVEGRRHRALRGPATTWTATPPCNGCGCGGNGVCSGSCSGTSCGCANGDCNNRKAGCTNFRYGQCNQGIACLGPIVCRLVTCIAPWEIDGTCTATCAPDNATATTTGRACTTSPATSTPPSRSPAGSGSPAGRIDADTSGPIDVHVYVDGNFARLVTAAGFRGDVAAAYPGMGAAHGFDVTVPAAPGVRQVCVYGINRGPRRQRQPHPVGCRTVTRRQPVRKLRGGAHRPGHGHRERLGHRPRHHGARRHPRLHRRQRRRPRLRQPSPARRRPGLPGLRAQPRLRDHRAHQRWSPPGLPSTPSTPAPVGTTTRCSAASDVDVGSPVGTLDGARHRTGRLPRRGLGARPRRHHRGRITVEHPSRRPAGRHHRGERVRAPTSTRSWPSARTTGSAPRAGCARPSCGHGRRRRNIGPRGQQGPRRSARSTS